MYGCHGDLWAARVGQKRDTRKTPLATVYVSPFCLSALMADIKGNAAVDGHKK